MKNSGWELINHTEYPKSWKYRNLRGDILNFDYRGDERYTVEKRTFNPSAAIMCLISILEEVSAELPTKMEGWRRTLVWDGRFEFRPEDYIRTWVI